MKIAYIEDDIDARDIFASKFKQDQIQCDVFTSAEESESEIHKGNYDALIIDIMLPGITGVQFLSKLRKQEIHIPSIIITAFNSQEHAKDALNSNACYLLEKPFSYQTLLKIVKQTIQTPSSIQHCVDRGLTQLNLTPRESEIAHYLLKGLSNAELANNFSLSEKTVKQYITQIFEKANVSSRAEFFSYIFPV